MVQNQNEFNFLNFLFVRSIGWANVPLSIIQEDDPASLLNFERKSPPFFFPLLFSKQIINTPHTRRRMSYPLISSLPGQVPGIKTTSRKRPLENPANVLESALKKGKFDPSSFNGGRIDEDYTNGLVQTAPMAEVPIRRHIFITGFAEDIEGNSNPDEMETPRAVIPTVTTQNICFVRKANMAANRDKMFTGVEISKYGAMFNSSYDRPLSDPVDTVLYNAGNLSYINYLMALQQVKAKQRGVEITRDQLLNEWYFGGVVSGEEGESGEATRSMAMGRPNVYGDAHPGIKQVVLTTHGPAFVRDVWGGLNGLLPNGTPLYFIFKKMPLPKQYNIEGPKPNEYTSPAVNYTMKGKVVDNTFFLDKVDSLSSVMGPGNLEAQREKLKREQRDKYDLSGSKVWQFIPYANHTKGHPTPTDLSYTDTATIDGSHYDYKMWDGVPILVGYVQKEKSAPGNAVNPMAVAVNNSAANKGRILEIVVSDTCVYM